MAINNRFESKSSAEQPTSKRGNDPVKTNVSYRPSKSPLGDGILKNTLWSRPRSLPRSPLRSRPVLLYQWANTPPGCNILRWAEKSTKESPVKSTGKVDQVDQHSPEATYRKCNQLSTVKSTKLIKILSKPHFKNTTMESTGRLLKRTFQDYYQVNQHLEVNASNRWLLLERCLMKWCMNAQQSGGMLEFGKFNHL